MTDNPSFDASSDTCDSSREFEQSFGAREPVSRDPYQPSLDAGAGAGDGAGAAEALQSRWQPPDQYPVTEPVSPGGPLPASVTGNPEPADQVRALEPAGGGENLAVTHVDRPDLAAPQSRWESPDVFPMTEPVTPARADTPPDPREVPASDQGRYDLVKPGDVPPDYLKPGDVMPGDVMPGDDKPGDDKPGDDTPGTEEFLIGEDVSRLPGAADLARPAPDARPAADARPAPDAGPRSDAGSLPASPADLGTGRETAARPSETAAEGSRSGSDWVVGRLADLKVKLDGLPKITQTTVALAPFGPVKVTTESGWRGELTVTAPQNVPMSITPDRLQVAARVATELGTVTVEGDPGSLNLKFMGRDLPMSVQMRGADTVRVEFGPKRDIDLDCGDFRLVGQPRFYTDFKVTGVDDQVAGAATLAAVYGLARAGMIGLEMGSALGEVAAGVAGSMPVLSFNPSLFPGPPGSTRPDST